jgi:PAS domain S-box-containing protein
MRRGEAIPRSGRLALLSSPVVRRVAGLLLLGLAYYAAARLSLQLALVKENVTPLWPPTGIAVVAFLLVGRRVWPAVAVAVAAFLVNLPIESLPAAAATAAGNTAAPLLAATLLARFGFRKEIDRARDAVAIVVAAPLSTTVSATVGTAALVFSGAVPRSEFAAAWSVWWAGDAMGVLVVAPFLLSLPLLLHPPWKGWRRRAEALGLFVGLGAAGWLVLRTPIPLFFTILPLLGLAAWRLQLPGAAPGALLISVLATWAAVQVEGPFAGEMLSDRMFLLQAFNLAVALTSFFFAALVTERLRAREALERARTHLEERVRDRTSDLSEANEQLAEAHRIAGLGSWEWDMAGDRVLWSDEMYRIHGYEPGAFGLTFDKAVELVVPEDVERIRTNIERALEERQEVLPDLDYRIVRPDGEERVLQGRAKLVLGRDGEPARMVGTVLDITERARFEQEHEIAETLQQALLPKELPANDSLELTARYVAPGLGIEVGGDWYDAVELSDGRLLITVGDVLGRGLDAAVVMGQLRMAARAHALADEDGPALVDRLDHLLRRIDPAQMATVVCVLCDPATGEIRTVSAGHPPPLVLAPDGSASFLQTPPSLPLGVAPGTHREEVVTRIDPGSTLILYTDGLVERRGASIDRGMEALRQAAQDPADASESLVDHLVSTLLPRMPDDDVALVAVSFKEPPDRLRLTILANPRELAPARRALARWLRARGAAEEEVFEIVLACNEACSNAIEHAYGPVDSSVQVEASLGGDEVEVRVRDFGAWRPGRDDGRGRGLRLIEGVMDGVEVTPSEDGTEVRMRRKLAGAVRG